MLGLDHLEFPLLFTDNSKADPIQAGSKWTTFSEYCKMYANGGLSPDHGPWQSPTENGRQKGYTPCPPDLMKDRNTNT